MNSQRNRTRFWLIIAGVVLLLFIFVFAAPNNSTPSQRGSQPPSDNTAFQLFIAIAPTLLIVWFLWRMIRGTKPGVNDALALGKNRYHTLTPAEATLTFNDIGDAEKAKADLKEVGRYLQDPTPFAALGTRPPNVLLTGAPGTGKTMLAKALCKEINCPLFYTSGSEFVEMFVGIGASRIRDLFEAAKKQGPAIVFVDALDAIGRRRETVLASTQSEYENALHQLMIEMDNLKIDTPIIVIAATNRPDLLDPALTRSGRLDRQINLNTPNADEREAILKTIARKKPVTPDVDWTKLAASTEGFVGADLERLLNEAALAAGRKGKTTIGMGEFESAVAMMKQNIPEAVPARTGDSHASS